MRPAAFFDLDRTVIRVNSATRYVQWLIRRGEARRRDLLSVFWWVTQYTLGVLDAEDLARRIARTLQGRDEGEFRELLRQWVHEELMPHVSTKARQEITRRREQGYLCAVLTSSTHYSAEPIAHALDIQHVLASRLDVIDGRFTGQVVPPLCYGHGKVILAEQWARAHQVDLDRSVFYTDSISDRPMLERVGERVVVNPDPRLWWLARRRGWPIEYW